MKLFCIFLACLFSAACAFAPAVRSSPRKDCHGVQPSQRLPSRLFLKFLEKTDDKPAIQLSVDEDKAIRAAANVLSVDDAFGVGWFDRPEAWSQAKQDYPILAPYDDSDLRDAYLKQKPNIVELFTGTPLGPFLLVNLLAKFTGFSWCQTPFHPDGACPPL